MSRAIPEPSQGAVHVQHPLPPTRPRVSHDKEIYVTMAIGRAARLRSKHDDLPWSKRLQPLHDNLKKIAI